MREDLEEMKKEVGKIKNEEKSFTLELLGDFKKQNKRQFIIILVVLTMWLATIGYLVYLLNDMGTTTTSEEYNQEITDLEDIDNSTITNGGN